MEIKGYREVKIKKSEDNRKVGRIGEEDEDKQEDKDKNKYRRKDKDNSDLFVNTNNEQHTAKHR